MVISQRGIDSGQCESGIGGDNGFRGHPLAFVPHGNVLDLDAVAGDVRFAPAITRPHGDVFADERNEYATSNGCLRGWCVHVRIIPALPRVVATSCPASL